MHILFLSDNFPPEVNAPASRTFEHCQEWVRAGHKVTIITCAPNFPRGKIFDGYRNKLWQRENLSGVVVIRVWTYITPNEGFVKRTIDHLSYMVTAFISSLFVKQVDIVIGTSPQFFTVCAAYVTSLCKRIPWVFELRDMWPDSIRAVGVMKHNTILDILAKIELFLYHKSSSIVSVTHSFKSALVQRGIDINKIHVVTNGVDLSRFAPREKDDLLQSKYSLQGKFVVGYIGTHGLAHALDTLLDTAKIFQSSPSEQHVRFMLLGDGAQKAALQKRASVEGIHNVIFVDSVSKSEVVRYWSILDVSIVHLKKDVLFDSVIPSKLFECMSMSIPVLHGVQGESACIVESEDVGLVFESENPSDLAEKISRVIKNKESLERFKKNGPIAAKKYERDSLANDLLQILISTHQRKTERKFLKK